MIPILSGNVSVGLSQPVIVLSPIFSAGRFSSVLLRCIFGFHDYDTTPMALMTLLSKRHD